MMALTLRPPWPWAVCFLGKLIENRGWAPQRSQLKAGETFAIHSGLMPPMDELHQAFQWMLEHKLVTMEKIPTLTQLFEQAGRIVAVCTYGGATNHHSSPWFVGRIGWRLWGEKEDTPPILIPYPVKCRGAQRLWKVPPDVLEQMRDQFRIREDR